MKKFIEEFKKFITRGNVLDMAVGVIVGSSFTAIVNALSNNILKPFINFLLALVFGKNSLSELYTFLKKATTTAESGELIVDLENSIYIDWGAFINAIINFFIVAFVLFCLVKIINKFRENTDNLQKLSLSRRKLRREMKKLGLNFKDPAVVEEFMKKKDEEKKEEIRLAEEAKLLEREKNPTDNDLLRKIVKLLESSSENK